MLEDVKEQEWKNSHVAYHDTHSVLLFFVLSFVFTYLLYKLYTCIRQQAATWFVRKEIPAAPIDVSYAAGPNDTVSTVNINIRNSNESLQLTDAASQSPKRSLRPQVAKSYF